MLIFLFQFTDSMIICYNFREMFEYWNNNDSLYFIDNKITWKDIIIIII